MDKDLSGYKGSRSVVCCGLGRRTGFRRYKTEVVHYVINLTVRLPYFPRFLRMFQVQQQFFILLLEPMNVQSISYYSRLTNA